MSKSDGPKSVKPDLTLFGDEHVRRYRETGGAEGYLWNGATCLLLTTRGRKTGALRDIPLICGFDGDRCIVVASKGGAPEHPSWYRNLQADPSCEVQVKRDRFAAMARTVDGSQRARLWKLMTEVWPSYEQYAERTTRIIPVVVLERVKK